jgi:hypothetical protein
MVAGAALAWSTQQPHGMPEVHGILKEERGGPFPPPPHTHLAVSDVQGFHGKGFGGGAHVEENTI